MKKILYLILATAYITASDNSQSSASDQKIHININNQPAINIPINQNQANSQTTSQTTSVMQTVSQRLTNAFHATAAALAPAAIQEKLTVAGKTTHSFCLAHKGEIALGSIAAAYAWLCYETLSGANYLTKSSCWSSWKNRTSLDDLKNTPQEIISRELLIDIQKRYISVDKPTEFILPLIHFLYDIDIELKTLVHYQRIGTALQRTGARYIVPFDTYRFTTIQERIARLAFVKNTFLTWAAHYKLEHNKTTLLRQLWRIRPDLMKE